MATRKVNVIIVGLTMEASKRLNPQMDTVAFGKRLDASIDLLSRVPGLYHRVFDVDHEAPPEAPNSIDSYKAAFKQGPPGGGSWDGQFIGAGLRLISPLTPLLEDIVNFVMTTSQAQTKLMFSKDGNDHWEAVRRAFEDLKMGERPSQNA